MQKTVLIVDDEVAITQLFERQFRDQPFRTLVANSGQQALVILEQESVAVIVADQRMPGMTGVELFAIVQQCFPSTVRLLLSGYTDFEALADAVNKGAISKFISKPWDYKKLRLCLDQALSRDSELSHRTDDDWVFHLASQAMLLLDSEYKIRSANPKQQNLASYRLIDLVGKSLFDALPELDREQVTSAVAACHQWSGELWLLRGDKSIGLFSLSLQQSPAAGRIRVSCTDITQPRRNELGSHHDLLTGLLNRQSFEQEVAEALRQSQAERVAVLSLNLTRFRQVNESYGHDVGDNLLCQVAASLRQRLADQQSINCIARIGGDEFALLCQAPDEAVVKQLCERVLQWFMAPIAVGEHEIFIHFKLGVARADAVGLSAADLIKHSVIAGSRSDRSQPYMIYSETMMSGVKEQMDLHNDLHKVVSNNELALVYQPKIELKTGRIVCAEALVRWDHPTKGLISPDQFVFLAEESGLILDIGDWCISEACRQLAQWQRQHIGPIRVAVNLSPRQFSDQALPQRLQALKNHYELPPLSLELEVTESTLLDDSECALETMQRIRQLGIEFAMDDFGTGYASFEYLKNYPFKTLKIDRSFIINLGHCERERSIVQSMIAMARQLQLSVVAEGVEQQAQADFLKTLGCDYIQGYLYSRPVGAKAFEQLLQNQPFVNKG